MNSYGLLCNVCGRAFPHGSLATIHGNITVCAGCYKEAIDALGINEDVAKELKVMRQLRQAAERKHA